MRPFLIDTDAGSDDAVALVMALRNEEILIEALTVVAGNVPLEKAVQNCLYVRELCEREVPIHAGADRPIERALETAQHIHGTDGLGDIGLELEGRAPTSENAVGVIVQAAQEHAGYLEIVTLGPLTNLALALRSDPELASRFHIFVAIVDEEDRSRRELDRLEDRGEELGRGLCDPESAGIELAVEELPIAQGLRHVAGPVHLLVGGQVTLNPGVAHASDEFRYVRIELERRPHAEHASEGNLALPAPQDFRKPRREIALATQGRVLGAEDVGEKAIRIPAGPHDFLQPHAPML